MKVRVKYRNLLTILCMMVLILYALSQQSWSSLISSSTWRTLFIIGISWFAIYLILYKREFTLFNAICILMTMFVLFNNANIKHGSYGNELVFLATILMITICCKNDFWINTVIKVFFLFGMFYAVFTILAFLSRGFYDSVIVPFITSHNSTVHMHLGEYYSKGFTAHYSFNGMYITMLSCITLSGLFKNGGAVKRIGVIKKDAIVKWALVLFSLISLLLTYKRAHILFTIAGVIFAFYIYNSNKPTTRALRLVLLLTGFLIVVYVVQSFVPGLFGFVERFQTGIETGDITNGRIQLWALGLAMTNGATLFGTGWYSFYSKYGSHVHNVYLQLYIETGIVGLTIFLLFMITCLVKTVLILVNSRKKRIECNNDDEYRLIISLIYQVFFLLYCFTGTCLYEATTLIPYFLFCSITEYYWRMYKDNISSSAQRRPAR